MQVSGLSSGLDTAAIVKQLMTLERSQGSYLTKGKSASQSLVNAYQSLNTNVKSLVTAASAFSPTSVLDTAAWRQTSVKSSNPELATATVGSKAHTGSLSFSVESLAQAGASVSSATWSAPTDVVSTGDFTFSLVKGKDVESAGAVRTEVTVKGSEIPGGATLNDVAAAINAKDAGVKATVVKAGEGVYRLQLASTAAGESTNVTLNDGTVPGGADPVLGGFGRLYTGADTVLKVGDGPGAYTVTSTSRQVSDVIPGVTVTAVKAQPGAVMTVDVTADATGLADKMKALVDAANKALDQVSDGSRWDATTKTGGPFVGDSAAREVSNKISTVFTGSSAFVPGTFGVDLTKDGTVTFDRDKFLKAYAEDPAAVEKSATAFSKKLVDVGKQITNSTDGVLTLRIQGEQGMVKDYTQQIAKFEERMDLRQQALERQFTALESMLSKLQSQGNWLAGQLATLPTNAK